MFPDVILEEEVFSSRNLGPDCSTIGDLLYDYGEKFILAALEDGEYAIAVDHYSSCWIRYVRTLSQMNTGAGLTISTLRITP